MSIFRSTFPPFICRQLNARQDLVSLEGNRPIEVLQYTTTKSPFVKMTSFVNYKDEKRKLEGDQLARKYVLSAGTLNPSSEDIDKFSMRYGIGSKNAAYGSNLGGRDYGLVPMPGITAVDIKSKSAYGSLREATVKFYCWDKKQLEDLEILFMRPGYTVLLEYGWSMYIDTFDATEPYDKQPDNGSINARIPINDKLANHSLIKSFDQPTINPFQPGLTQDAIYAQISKLNHKFSGNYDACLGKIVNFSWSILPNGGFECTTVLISIGDVLDSLKMNSITGETAGNQTTGNQTTKTYKTKFEILLEQIKYNAGSFSDINTLNESALRITGLDTSCRYLTYNKRVNEEYDSDSIYYIQFAYLIHLINEKFNLFNGTQKLFDIEIPLYNPNNTGNGLCIASKHSISIDPTICIIKNSKATFYSQNTDKKGFDLVQRFSDQNTITQRDINKSQKEMNEFLIDEDNLGVIGNIYVSVDKVENIYRNLIRDNNGSAELNKLLKGVLDSLSYALGSVNDFDIFVLDNKCVIIDKHYTEFGKDSSAESKFMLNLIGNNNNNRNISVQSKIFSNMTSMIAIAAQNRENIAGIQSSTQVYLNKGMSNRISDKLTETINDNDVAAETKRVISDISNLVDYVNQMYNKQLPGQTDFANSSLNSLILKVSKDTNYKAVIPLSLEFTTDGIGGIIIGNIFTVNPDALPIEYSRKNIGFIVTGISHKLIRSDWTTSLTTQICLLDQDNFDRFDSSSLEGDIGINLTTNFENNKRSIAYYNLLVATLKDYYEAAIEPSGVGFVPTGKKTTIQSQGGNSFEQAARARSNSFASATVKPLTLNIVVNDYKTEADYGVTSATMLALPLESLEKGFTDTIYYTDMTPDIQNFYLENYRNFVYAYQSNKKTPPINFIIKFPCYLPDAVKSSGELDNSRIIDRIIEPDYEALR